MAEKYGLTAEAYATPTGLFVSIHKNSDSKKSSDQATSTSIGRIKEYVINLNQLCWLETLLEDVIANKISLNAAQRILKTTRFKKPVYSLWQRSLASLAVGSAVSFPNFADPLAAFLSGLITFGAFWVSGPLFAKLVESAIFRDFMGALFTLAMATFSAWLLGGSIDAYSIGGIILLVPGLTITTAISELADQNFISGTAKLMKGVLTLLSIGTAYILFQEFIPGSIPNTSATLSRASQTPILISALCTIISVTGFSLIFQVPKKALPWAALAGLISWAVFRQFESARYMVLASFLSSFSVGALSLILGSIFRTPSQVYSVPGILALLPGMLALSSFRSLAAGRSDGGIQTAFQVTLIAGTIVFGLFFARIPYAIIRGALKLK
jgi:uncharacterized membrane protein YjjB (DUF3815 family)